MNRRDAAGRESDRWPRGCGNTPGQGNAGSVAVTM